MSLRALGYVGVGATDLTDWTRFATAWLGMQAVDRSASSRAFRMDDRKQRLIVDAGLPKVRISLVGRWPMRPRWMPWRQGLKRPACRCGANRAHLRTNAASRG